MVWLGGPVLDQERNKMAGLELCCHRTFFQILWRSRCNERRLCLLWRGKCPAPILVLKKDKEFIIFGFKKSWLLVENLRTVFKTPPSLSLVKSITSKFLSSVSVGVVGCSMDGGSDMMNLISRKTQYLWVEKDNWKWYEWKGQLGTELIDCTSHPWPAMVQFFMSYLQLRFRGNYSKW